MSYRNLGARKRLALAEAIRVQVTDRLRQLAADPHYMAAPIGSRLRSDARRRLLAQIQTKHPDASLFLLQRVIEQVARDLSTTKDSTP